MSTELPRQVLLGAIVAVVCQHDFSGHVACAWGDQSHGEIAAKVGAQEIRVAAVQDALRQTLGERTLTGETRTLAEAQALEQLINRRLVLVYLDRAKITASPAELAEARKGLEREIVTSGLKSSAGSHSGAIGAPLDAATAEKLAWQVRWNKYLDQQLTDQKLEAFFNAHRRDFDGTELRVSHILFKGDALSDAKVRTELLAQATKVREVIANGKLAFAAAAEKYSAGPSRRMGGDLGFIPRRDRMVEAFSKAAFALERGQLSQPVTTPFGVHLIQVTDVRAGKKSWRESRADLSPAFAQDLFKKLADEMRTSVIVEYTGLLPHIDSRTGEVVPAKK